MKFALVTWQPKPNSTNDFQSFCEMYFATSMTRQTAHIPTDPPHYALSGQTDA
jgi:hypothetical protein